MNKPGFISNKRAILLSASAVLIFSMAASFLAYYSGITATVRGLHEYGTIIYGIERLFIEKYPIYSDHVTPGMEMELRKHLLPDHLCAVRSGDIQPLSQDSDINEFVKKGLLVPLDPGVDDFYFFYNVPQKYRYATDATKKGLETVMNRFQEKLRLRAPVPPVKIAVSSVLRPGAYQKNLKGSNKNASDESTHSYGRSFDVFYDDFYVILPVYDKIPWLAEPLFEQFRKKCGFMLGDSLRRQFRAVLSDTLIELQNEGIIYAIFEKRQSCYHITIL
ncbi:MAG: hypothetical protein CVV44_04615 [Spirochaetae bacterium HGW-Spirochaetae-1]|jgi:hypothetical protein|nr:MAG: hypothetical protein CVV44_04615 [Spirochaetae bacterium HGW-Spirochaetae-1]